MQTPTSKHRSDNHTPSRSDASPSTSTSTSDFPRRRGLRRRTLTFAGTALFLSGLLFGEAIEAVADVLEEPPAAAVATPEVSLQANASRATAAQSERVVEAVSVELFERMHTRLMEWADEGITLERRRIWEVLADCESGDWAQGVPVPDSRRWDSTAGFFEGGLQFHPGTWDGFRDRDMPDHAYDATPIQQMVVAERVLEAQGWGAWPVCSRKVGYR